MGLEMVQCSMRPRTCRPFAGSSSPLESMIECVALGFSFFECTGT